MKINGYKKIDINIDSSGEKNVKEREKVWESKTINWEINKE